MQWWLLNKAKSACGTNVVDRNRSKTKCKWSIGKCLDMYGKCQCENTD